MADGMRSSDGNGKKILTRADVLDVLERVLGKPNRTLRDAHLELMMVDRQRALLSRIFWERPPTLVSIEDVELFFDALEEYGECEIPACLYGERGPVELSPPPLTPEEMRQIVGLCALRRGLEPAQLLVEVNRGLVDEQMRLRSEFVQWEEPSKRTAVASGTERHERLPDRSHYTA